MEMGMATGNLTVVQRKRTTGPCCKKRKKNGANNNAIPPLLVMESQECPSVMRAHVLEVPAGRDVVSCVAQFARRARRGVLVLGAAGRVTDVVLRRDPLRVGGGASMEILSLAGCFFPFSGGTAAVFLAGPHGGAVLGGGVCRVVAAGPGPVVVMVATFVAAALDRLPLPTGKNQQMLS